MQRRPHPLTTPLAVYAVIALGYVLMAALKYMQTRSARCDPPSVPELLIQVALCLAILATAVFVTVADWRKLLWIGVPLVVLCLVAANWFTYPPADRTAHDGRVDVCFQSV